MAHRRCLLIRANLVDRRCYPSFGYVLHSDEGKRERTDDKSSLDSITDKFDIVMSDVADVLPESTMETVASQAPVVDEVAIAAADSFLSIQLLQYLIDAVAQNAKEKKETLK
ncbi:hypothetical protein RJT34_23733 [Clitoria ternatea]|uniref:Uncharacterized protein n=1 Tax=Clitoria ternatea TaxID=43366 RepID=A0AAN9FLN4_CLITE